MSQEQLWEILTPIIGMVLTGAVTYIGYIVTRLINIHIARIQHEQLDDRVYKIVRAAEQMGGTPAAKLDYATEQTALFAASLGLTLSRAEIRTLVEAAVHAMTVEETATTATATATISTNAPTTSTTVPETGTTAPVITTNAWDYNPV